MPVRTASRLNAEGWRPLTAVALNAGRIAWYWHHPVHGVKRVMSEASVPAGTHPSLVPAVPAWHWDEREIMDLFGITFVGHPDPRPLVLYDSGRSWQPMTDPADGVVIVPVGPVHAGIIESGHFVFSLLGETILHLDIRLFNKHRGVERLLEGRTPEQAIAVIERTCAACSASHQAAFAQALESLVGFSPDPRLEQERAILLELERMYNHVNDLSAVAAGTGFQVPANEGARLKEDLLRANQRVYDHRYLFGTIRPFGSPQPLSEEHRSWLLEQLPAWQGRWQQLDDRLFNHHGFRDRLTGTGVLSYETVVRQGAVGPIARASGWQGDLRRDLAYGAYRGVDVRVASEEAGDVLARVRVRVSELDESARLLKHWLTGLSGEVAQAPAMAWSGGNGEALGYTESPRGANVHYLGMSGGVITRYHIRSASFANWPLIMEAVRGEVVGDFPLINKSFELCYSCCDR